MRKLKKKCEIIKYCLLAVSCYLFRFSKIKNNKIVFSSFNGKSYGDSPAKISEYISDNFSGYDIVWLINKDLQIELPQGIRRVNNNTFAAMRELSTAKIWVDSHLKFWWQRKRKAQIYIQTFHGCIALKKVDADAIEMMDPKMIDRDKYNASIIDYYVSNSEFCDNMYRSALLYQGKILRIGCPRNDLFFANDERIKLKVKESLGISPERKIVLYAPTFRNNGNIDIYNIDYHRLLSTLSRSSLWGNSNWCIVVRLHPIIGDAVRQRNDNEMNVFDATSYPNMQELEYTSDIMISDYSSCIFDSLIMNKVGILYASDYTSYIQGRGLYWDYFDLPFPVSQTNDELCDIINNFDMDLYNRKMHQFKDRINLMDDGKATKRLCEMIVERTNNALH